VNSLASALGHAAKEAGLKLKAQNFFDTVFIECDGSVYNEICNLDFNNQNKQTKKIQVRLYELANLSRIRDLGPSEIDKLVCIRGIVIRNSEIIPEMREACFKCGVCNKYEMAVLNRTKIIEPVDCKNCNSKHCFELIHNRSLFSDKQHVKLQETPEHMPEGETPITVHLCCYDDLVDYTKPGDRCEIIGVYRAQGIRLNPKHRTTRTIFRTYIDVISFTKLTNKKTNSNNEDSIEQEHDVKISDFEKEIIELSKNPDIYNILVDSFAPSIWENEDVKKGLLLQLFGGVSKDFSDIGGNKFRGDINVLLIGDPSTAKSQLLQYVHSIAPRGIFTSGKVI